MSLGAEVGLEFGKALAAAGDGEGQLGLPAGADAGDRQRHVELRGGPSVESTAQAVARGAGSGRGWKSPGTNSSVASVRFVPSMVKSA